MERYESYKPSGIPWIGEIPAHWEILKLKNLFWGFTNGTSLEQIKSGETDFPVTRIETISSGRINKGKVGFVDYSPILNRFILNSGDILISHINSYERIGNNALVLDEDCPIYHGMNLLRIRPREGTNSQFVLSFLRSPYFLIEMQTNCKPAINQVSVSSGRIKSIPIPVPPVEEQRKIVEFLSSKTLLIDAQQRERERELRLLDELKQAEIANVVTRGLNPNVPMKDSGIFWVPRIPAHWEVHKLKYILKKLDRKREPNSELLICSNKGEVFPRGEAKLGLVSDSEEIYQGVKAGDLLIHGMDTWHGAIGVSSLDGMCTPVVHVCDTKQNKKYVYYYLRFMAFQKVFKLISNGVRQNTSDFRSWDKLAAILIPIPPIDEQDAIVEYIEKRTSTIDSLITNLRAEIDFLTEYKQRLIADVVTGQVKV